MQELERMKILKNKHLVISEKNYEKLKSMGKMGETFDDVLTKILSHQVGVHRIDVEDT